MFSILNVFRSFKVVANVSFQEGLIGFKHVQTETYFHLEVFTHEPTAAFGLRLVYCSCIRCRVSTVEE